MKFDALLISVERSLSYNPVRDEASACKAGHSFAGWNLPRGETQFYEIKEDALSAFRCCRSIAAGSAVALGPVGRNGCAHRNSDRSGRGFSAQRDRDTNQ